MFSWPVFCATASHARYPNLLPELFMGRCQHQSHWMLAYHDEWRLERYRILIMDETLHQRHTRLVHPNF
jgi:hypothetical protein